MYSISIRLDSQSIINTDVGRHVQGCWAEGMANLITQWNKSHKGRVIMFKKNSTNMFSLLCNTQIGKIKGLGTKNCVYLTCQTSFQAENVNEGKTVHY